MLVALARGSEIIHRDIDDQRQRLPHVIEHDDGIGEHHVEIRRAEVVVRARRDARLEASHDIIGKKADRAAEKTRQAGNFRGLEALHFLAQLLEGVRRDPRFGCAAGPDDIGAVAARAHDHRRFGPEKGIAPPFLAAANAFQQERVVAARDLQKRRYGRLQVGGDFAADGNQVEPVAREPFELLQVRQQRHFVFSRLLPRIPRPSPSNEKGRRIFARGPLDQLVLRWTTKPARRRMPWWTTTSSPKRCRLRIPLPSLSMISSRLCQLSHR